MTKLPTSALPTATNINVDAAPGFDPTTVVVSDDGTNTVLDFGFGTITLDGVTGGAERHSSPSTTSTTRLAIRYRDRVMPATAGRLPGRPAAFYSTQLVIVPAAHVFA